MIFSLFQAPTRSTSSWNSWRLAFWAWRTPSCSAWDSPPTRSTFRPWSHPAASSSAMRRTTPRSSSVCDCPERSPKCSTTTVWKIWSGCCGIRSLLGNRRPGNRGRRSWSLWRECSAWRDRSWNCRRLLRLRKSTKLIFTWMRHTVLEPPGRPDGVFWICTE